MNVAFTNLDLEPNIKFDVIFSYSLSNIYKEKKNLHWHMQSFCDTIPIFLARIMWTFLSLRSV